MVTIPTLQVLHNSLQSFLGALLLLFVGGLLSVQPFNRLQSGNSIATFADDADRLMMVEGLVHDGNHWLKSTQLVEKGFNVVEPRFLVRQMRQNVRTLSLHGALYLKVDSLICEEFQTPGVV